MSVEHLDGKSFDAFVSRQGLALVDFWAEWCGPCRMLGPELEALAGEHAELSVGKVNVDTDPEPAVKLGVDTIPALFLYKDGRLVKKLVGFMRKQDLESNLGL